MNPRIAQIRTQAETELAGFLAARARLPAGALAQARESAVAVFTNNGLPHRRVEAWHYTDLRNLMREAWPLAATPTPKIAANDGLRVTIADGACTGLPRLPPPGVTMRALRDVIAAGGDDLAAKLFPAIGADDSIVALNAGLAQDGVVIEIARGTEVAAPIEIEFISSDGAPRSDVSRSLVIVGDGATATVIETHTSNVRVQRNSALICRLGENASLDHVFVAAERAPDMHIASLIADVGGHATFQSFGFIAGGDVLRRQCFIRQSGEYAKIGLRGVSLLAGKQHADTTLVVDHAVPHGESRELFKHIVMDQASGVYQGKVIVRPHAQKTDGAMKSQALLLSDDAAMSNKPELEIFADDVVCGHGATVAQIDDDQLFYLMSRGLPKAQAEGMLIEAFAREAIEFIANEALRARCEAALGRWLEARG